MHSAGGLGEMVVKKGIIWNEEIFIGNIRAICDNFSIHQRVIPGDVDIIPLSINSYLVPGVGLYAGAIVGSAIEKDFF